MAESCEDRIPNKEFKPLGNICEFLNALHVYADEARSGKARFVETTHFCSHVRKDLRQCLLYDFNRPNARLLGIEYMIPKEAYLKLDSEEQKLWHSHEYEISSGMQILPKLASVESEDEWNANETEGMTEIAGLYGKTFHTWQIDRDEHIPLGLPVLMGSLTKDEQVDLDKALEKRNKEFNVHHKIKAEMRAKAGVKGPGIHQNADSWWRH